MKQISITLLLTFLGLSVSSQPVDVFVYSGSGASKTLQIQTKKTETKGSFYYNDNWKPGEIYLITGEVIKDYPLKYDLRKNIIEIKVENIVKVLSVGRVKEIHWIDDFGNKEILRNAMLYENYNGTGLFSILLEGNKSFLKKPYLKLIESNYVTALDVGEKSNQIVKRNYYFIAEGNKVIEIKKSKKQILKQFGDNADIIKEFAQKNKLSYKNDNDLIKIFSYYNSL
ncbi:MAG: hypothetical protein L3J35_09870 [Bacteroidales bacterium]|nr:hypothetical protein [Bacteroidales bacterium]